MILRAYLDESGTHGGSKYIVLGGVVSSAQKWDRFAPKWTEHLQKFGVDHLHAKEYRRGDGVFKGWTRAKDAAFGDELLELSRKYVGFALTMRLDTKDYKEIYRGGQQPRKLQFDSAYGLAFRIWLHEAVKHAFELYQDHPTRPKGFHVILEDGHRNIGGAEEVFDDFKRYGRPKIPLKTFTRGNKSDPGCQIADLITHNSWRREEQDVKFTQVPANSSMAEMRAINKEPMHVIRDHIEPEFLQTWKDALMEADIKRMTGSRRI